MGPKQFKVNGDWALRAFNLFFFTTLSVIVVYFPLYFHAKGYSKVEIGILFSIGPAVGIISNMIWGWLGDKTKAIKKLMILALFVQLLAAAIIFQVESFRLLFLIMIFFYFFQTPVQPLTDSLILLSVSGTRKTYASFRVWGSVGFAGASLLFGILLSKMGASVVGVLYMITAFLSLLVAFTLEDRQGNIKKFDFSGLLKVIGSKPFLRFLLFLFFVSVAHRANDAFLSLYLKQLGAPDTYAGISWAISSGSEILMFALFIKYGDRFKTLPLLGFSCAMYALRFVVYGMVSSPLWILLLQFSHSLSYSVFYLAAIRYLQELIPDEYRASGLAAFTVVWAGLAGIVSGTLGGWLFERVSPSSVYYFSSILSIIASAGFYASHIRHKMFKFEAPVS